MKRRIGLTIAILVIVLIVGLLGWRFWPQSASNVMPVSKDNITSFSAYGLLNNGELGHCDFYSLNSPVPLCDEPEEVLEILFTSKYQQDFRNLLPWGVDGVSADKNYDGNLLGVDLYFQDKQGYIEFQFLSNSIVVVRTSEQPNMRIYHPTNSTTFDKLVEYLQTHGVLQ